MVKPMKLRDMVTALRANGCTPAATSGRGNHTKWLCPCGLHSANIPRHGDVTPGVVADTNRRLACLPEGWI